MYMQVVSELGFTESQYIIITGDIFSLQFILTSKEKSLWNISAMKCRET